MMLRAGLGTADMEYPLVDVQNALVAGLPVRKVFGGGVLVPGRSALTAYAVSVGV